MKRRATHFWSANWSTWLIACAGSWKSRLSLELQIIKSVHQNLNQACTHESKQSGVDISPWAALAAIFPATEMAGKGYPLATPGVFGVDAAELTQARWVASNDRQVVAIHNAIVRIFVSRNRDNAPLLGHPYATRVIKVDKHTKERTRGLAQLSVLVLPIEMPLHLSSPTWVLSKVWAKCQAPEGQERKEAQLHQCNEDISSNTPTKRCPNVTWNNMKEVVWNHVSLSMTP